MFSSSLRVDSTVSDGIVAREQTAFAHAFPDDEACLNHLMRLRYGDAITCPKCERVRTFYKIRQMPAYACQACGHHLHPMAQTRFAHSRIGLRAWFYAVYLCATNDGGISPRDLQRALGVSYKTAWRMRTAIVDAKFALLARAPQHRSVEFEDLLQGLAAAAASA